MSGELSLNPPMSVFSSGLLAPRQQSSSDPYAHESHLHPACAVTLRIPPLAQMDTPSATTASVRSYDAAAPDLPQLPQASLALSLKLDVRAPSSDILREATRSIVWATEPPPQVVQPVLVPPAPLPKEDPPSDVKSPTVIEKRKRGRPSKESLRKRNAEKLEGEAAVGKSPAAPAVRTSTDSVLSKIGRIFTDFAVDDDIPLNMRTPVPPSGSWDLAIKAIKATLPPSGPTASSLNNSDSASSLLAPRDFEFLASAQTTGFSVERPDSQAPNSPHSESTAPAADSHRQSSAFSKSVNSSSAFSPSSSSSTATATAAANARTLRMMRRRGGVPVDALDALLNVSEADASALAEAVVLAAAPSPTAPSFPPPTVAVNPSSSSSSSAASTPTSAASPAPTATAANNRRGRPPGRPKRAAGKVSANSNRAGGGGEDMGTSEDRRSTKNGDQEGDSGDGSKRLKLNDGEFEAKMQELREEETLAREFSHPDMLAELKLIEERYQAKMGLALSRRNHLMKRADSLFEADAELARNAFFTRRGRIRQEMIAAVAKDELRLKYEHRVIDLDSLDTNCFKRPAHYPPPQPPAKRGRPSAAAVVAAAAALAATVAAPNALQELSPNGPMQNADLGPQGGEAPPPSGLQRRTSFVPGICSGASEAEAHADFAALWMGFSGA
ncbi:hypothetical protein DFJ73DRAFT_817467 [Zopfochytrium polystomum]|nr:hypothetical protein DFJ73DRAFT_817467 [Zopfochytrium polystomum]